MKRYPAIEVRGGEPDLVAAAADDFGPTAIDEHDDATRVFFSTTEARDAALRALAATFTVTAIEVDDEDWARRSQENLQPVTVGRITIVPNPEPRTREPQNQNLLEPRTANPEPRPPNLIVIHPSMGFGTGHHATTRLCLAALQEIEVRGKFVLDVGTGSGVLAIAADRLGASGSLGIDVDPDAIQSARENLAFNPGARNVRFEVADLTSASLPEADVVVANLTGALLIKSASVLSRAARETLIISGLLLSERLQVSDTYTSHVGVRHLHGATQVSDTYTERLKVEFEREEDGWVVLAMKKR